VSRKRKKATAEANPQEPPRYIVSYAAMMTILLAFFIMLNNLATVREYGLLGAGMGLFRMSFNSFGLPGFLSGARTPANLNEVGGKFVPEDDDRKEDGKKPDNRLISPDKRDMKETLMGLLKTEERVALPLDIEYSRRLNQKSRNQLDALARLIRQRDADVMILASLPESMTDADDPWQEAGAWAMRVGRYLTRKGRVGRNRVITVGSVDYAEEEEGARRPSIRVVLRAPERDLKAPSMGNGRREDIYDRTGRKRTPGALD